MVARKASKGAGKKLKAKKQTLKNLDASRRSVKGGVIGVGIVRMTVGLVCRAPGGQGGQGI